MGYVFSKIGKEISIRIAKIKLKFYTRLQPSSVEKKLIDIAVNPFISDSDLVKEVGKFRFEERMLIAKSSRSPSFLLNTLADDLDWRVRAEVVLNPNVSAFSLLKMSNNIQEHDSILELISEKSEMFSTFCETPVKAFNLMTTQSMSEIHSCSTRFYIMLTSNQAFLSELYFLCVKELESENRFFKKSIEYILEQLGQNQNLPIKVMESMYYKKINVERLFKNRNFRKTSVYKIAELLHL